MEDTDSGLYLNAEFDINSVESAGSTAGCYVLLPDVMFLSNVV